MYHLTCSCCSKSGSHVGEKFFSPPQVGNHSCPRQNLQIVSSVCCFRRDSSVQLILWHFCLSSAFTGQSEPRAPATSKGREFTTSRNWQGYKSGSDLEVNSESRLVPVETENYVERNIGLWKEKCGLPFERFKFRIPACIKMCDFIEIFLWRRNSEGDRVVEVENMWAVLLYKVVLRCR